MREKRITAPDITAAKGERKLTVITAYDAGQAGLAEAAGADILLVGDSLGMVVLGQPDTLGVTMSQMLHHVSAVSTGATKALVLADMPFMSYQADIAQAVRNAGRLVKLGRAQAVKLEGGGEILPQVRAIVGAGIPVMGHLGLTPQHVAALGGYRVQAKTAREARLLLDDALALAEAGCFALVLECVPSQVAEIVTQTIPIPTIGIGAGPACDGQVLVFHDLLGLYEGVKPRFVKCYAELGALAREALGRFTQEVRSGRFPAQEHGFAMDPEEYSQLRLSLKKN
ncbi:MAG: 3-methyl-2-oxobutanoate hydroxymethyltransferase [Desulfovibrio sp.]|jgi:3-methyl-2-oxobutanoate hydroxymethyltransferase|nr:3-methyl-2-oxobutanoate hydroxymethyltransferase [Desulfovibrio sp.]MBI4959512.1 3-methyl-2-oxobutanoate hydroxymethyltransferase [Desulfovibrio sp.]